MDTETILNAMIMAIQTIIELEERMVSDDKPEFRKATRQYRAFRDRILRMDAEKDEAIRLAKNYIRNTEQQLAEKDTKIAELEAEKQSLEYQVTEMQNDPIGQILVTENQWLLDEYDYYKNGYERQGELLIRAMNALEGWRVLLDMPITEIMRDIERELTDG